MRQQRGVKPVNPQMEGLLLTGFRPEDPFGPRYNSGMPRKSRQVVIRHDVVWMLSCRATICLPALSYCTAYSAAFLVA